MWTPESIAQLLAEENPDALLAEGFEDAFLGVVRRCGQPSVAAYSYELGVATLVAREKMTYEEAEEWMEFNVVGAWMGPGTPAWICSGDLSAVATSPSKKDKRN